MNQDLISKKFKKLIISALLIIPFFSYAQPPGQGRKVVVTNNTNNPVPVVVTNAQSSKVQTKLISVSLSLGVNMGAVSTMQLTPAEVFPAGKKSFPRSLPDLMIALQEVVDHYNRLGFRQNSKFPDWTNFDNPPGNAFFILVFEKL